MPLSFDIDTTVQKKKKESNRIFLLIDHFDFKDVHIAVGKRQDQQKYLIQHLRANEFIRKHPHVSEPETRMLDFYRRNKWLTSDNDKKIPRKVCLPFPCTSLLLFEQNYEQIFYDK